MVNSPGFIAHVQGLGAKRVELIPNGADPSMFDPNDDGLEFRRAYGLKAKFVAMYAGAHGMSNDLDVVLDAAKMLRDVTVTSDIQIVFVGDGKEKPALQKRAQEMKLTNVTFVSSLPKNEMPAALAASDACIAILKPLEEYKTTYPNKVFDYMAAGRPVLLAIDGVIREVVEAANCGIFVEPGNPSALAEGLRQLASDREKSRLMGQRGRTYLEEHFSREKITQDLAKMLEGLNGERGWDG
jgi:glycosyltransferase involved in cell wall biosynthesis